MAGQPPRGFPSDFVTQIRIIPKQPAVILWTSLRSGTYAVHDVYPALERDLVSTEEAQEYMVREASPERLLGAAISCTKR